VSGKLTRIYSRLQVNRVHSILCINEYWFSKCCYCTS
jgi:hypothetical protein